MNRTKHSRTREFQGGAWVCDISHLFRYLFQSFQTSHFIRKAMHSTREPAGSTSCPWHLPHNEIKFSVLAGRWEVVAIWLLGCFLAPLTTRPRVLRKHIFKDWESWDHDMDFFLLISILQPEPKDLPMSSDSGNASFPFPATLLRGRLLPVLFFLFQVPGENEKQWKPALVVLTDKDLLIYDSMPRRKEAWLSPVHMHPLLATR